MLTTRLNRRYSLALVVLRASVVGMTDGDAREAILKKIDDLADLLAAGVSPLQQVPLALAQAELEAERAREGKPLGDFVTLELPTDSRINQPTEAA